MIQLNISTSNIGKLNRHK